MTTTIEIKNNTIKLPAVLAKKLKNGKALIHESGNIITLTIIPLDVVPSSTQALRQLGGSLKGKIKIDPAKWQRKIRKEWERKII